MPLGAVAVCRGASKGCEQGEEEERNIGGRAREGGVEGARRRIGGGTREGIEAIDVFT